MTPKQRTSLHAAAAQYLNPDNPADGAALINAHVAKMLFRMKLVKAIAAATLVLVVVAAALVAAFAPMPVGIQALAIVAFPVVGFCSVLLIAWPYATDRYLSWFDRLILPPEPRRLREYIDRYASGELRAYFDGEHLYTHDDPRG